VIVLPDADDPVLVSMVRLGQGGLIVTVTPASSGSAREEERPLKLTARSACASAAGHGRLRTAGGPGRDCIPVLGSSVDALQRHVIIP